MVNCLQDGVWVLTRGSWGRKEAIRPLDPNMAGGGDHIAARCLVMGRAGAPGTHAKNQYQSLGCCALARYLEQLWAQVPGCGPKSWRLAHRPHPCIQPLSTLPNDKATREFCFRRAPGALEGTYMLQWAPQRRERSAPACAAVVAAPCPRSLIHSSVIPPKPPSEGLKSPFWRDWVSGSCVRLS